MAQRSVLLLLALLLAAPFAAAAPSHENFQRASTDAEALAALGRTALNLTEQALTATLVADDANATRHGRLLRALTDDLDLIASLSDVESADLLAPYVAPYTGIARNNTNVTTGFAELRAAPTVERGALKALVRADVLGMYPDADAFDALGHDTTRLRELLRLLLAEIERIPAEGEPPAPYLVLRVEPARVPLGGAFVARGVVVGDIPASASVRLFVDGTPWVLVVPDAAGGFRQSGGVPVDARLGEHVVRAEMAARGRTLDAEATFEVTRLSTRLTLAPSRSAIRPDEDIVLQGRLLDGFRQPIPGSVGALRIDNGTAADVTFLSDGSMSVRLRGGDLGLGRHNATLAYAGDARHEPALARATWVVGNETAANAPPAADGTPDPADPRRGPDAPLGTAPILIPPPVAGGQTGAAPDPRTNLLGFLLGLPWLLWALFALALIAAELVVTRYVARRPGLLAPSAPSGPVALAQRLASLARPGAPATARAVIFAAYQDLLRALVREQVPVAAMTAREVGRVLQQRGLAADDVAVVTSIFEIARYSALPVDRREASVFLPRVQRMLRRT